MLLRSAGFALTLSLSAFAQNVPFPNSTTWTSLGPTRALWTNNQWPESSGRIKAIAIDPSGTLYIGAAGGGVWKRGNGAWTPLTDFQASLNMGAIAIDPGNPNVIFAGTGEVGDALADYSGAGLLKSTDGGATWIHIIGPFLDSFASAAQQEGGEVATGARFAALAISPGNSNVLLAAIEIGPFSFPSSGIFRSTDGGLNWTPVLTGDAGTSVLFDPANGNIAYAGLGSTINEPAAGIYKSTDGGATWTLLTGKAPNLLPTSGLGMVRLAISPSNPLVLYAGIASNINLGALLGLYTTADGGATWTQLTAAPDYCQYQCFYDHTLAVHPTNANILVAGGDGFNGNLLYVTTDGGMHWSEIGGAVPNRLHDDVQMVAFSQDGSTLYAATDGGFAWSNTYTAATPTWNFMNDNLAITQFYGGFNIDPTMEFRLFAGTQDNGFLLFDKSYVWNEVAPGEGGNILYDEMLNTAFMGGTTLAYTQFGYYALTLSDTGVNLNEPHATFLPLDIDFQSLNGTTQYTATDRVYQTLNEQGLWTPISPVLAGTYAWVSSIAVSATQPNQVCAGTSDGRFWCTTNANLGAQSTWTEHSTGLPGRYITRVRVSQYNPSQAALSFSGVTAPPSDPRGHVFYTPNLGGNWSDSSGNLPNSPSNDVEFDPATGQLYTVMDQGVFRTLDGGANWAPLGQGLPHAVVTGLYFEHFSRELTLSTMGRSMWRIVVPAVNATTPPGPTATFSSWTMDFSAHFGGPKQSQTVTVINAGSPAFGATPMNWTATPMPAFGGAWLGATPGSGTDTTPVSVSANVNGLPLGRYNGVVRVSAPGMTDDPVDLTVRLAVTDSAPMAVAPASQTVNSTGPSGAVVTLDGTGSTDPDSDPLTYQWTWASGSASGPQPAVTLPVGATTVTLTVSDPAGLSASATTTITVIGASGMVANLISAAQTMGFQQGVGLLDSALSAIQKGNSNAACGKMKAFGNQVSAQTGKQLTAAQAARLTASANDITGTLACQ